MEVFRVPKDAIEDALPTVLGLVERAVESDRTATMSDVIERIRRHTLAQWLVAGEECGVVAAGLTSFVTVGNEKRLVVNYCGGAGISEWLHLIDEISEFGAANGCGSVVVEGRPGWCKMLKQHGFESKPYFEKVL